VARLAEARAADAEGELGEARRRLAEEKSAHAEAEHLLSDAHALLQVCAPSRGGPVRILRRARGRRAQPRGSVSSAAR
jgi:hypothetical protein